MGDTNPIRTVGSTTWFDPFAALEDTKGSAFQHAVKEEDDRWSSAVHALPTSAWKREFESFQEKGYPESLEYAIKYTWGSYTVAVQPSITGYTKHVWILDCQTVVWEAEDLTEFKAVPNSTHFLTIRDIGSGAERLELAVYRLGRKTPLWKRSPVGPTIAVKDHLFYTGVENALRYNSIYVTSLTTGHSTHCIYEQKDKRVQVSLFESEDDVLVHEANAIFQRCGFLRNNTLKWITPVIPSTLVPLTADTYATNRFLKNGTRTIPYPKGHFLEDATLGPEKTLFVSLVQNGKISLWLWVGKWIRLYGSPALGFLHMVKEPTMFPMFRIGSPTMPTRTLQFRDFVGLEVVSHMPLPLPLHTVEYSLANGIPYQIVSHVAKPVKVVIDAYGAYGISSRRSYPLRWLPYLKRGYAFAYVCPRGGRENGDAWWNQARGAVHKEQTFTDTAAAIQEIQNVLGLGKDQTLFFGRSAGGWLAARIAQDYRHLVGAVYAEVPYVDVLRTTTNPALPLTQLEYDEFGDPLHRPEEFKALQKLSPVDTVPVARGDEPTIVIRTALHDMQVLPYEALKWSKHLNQKGWEHVFVGIDHAGGHFAPPTSMAIQRAEDAAILDAALSHKVARRSRKTRKNRSKELSIIRPGKMTSRRRSSKKQVTRTSTS
jgi:pimeloyl-ACP methyl ester carboxylesterase